MKRSLVLALALLALAAGVAQAFCTGFRLSILRETPEGYSSIYGDCNLSVEAGVPTRLHFFINCDIGSDQLSHVEVSYPAWPADPTPEQGRMEFFWLADTVNGNLRDGLVLDWSVPRTCEQVVIDGGIWPAYRLGAVEIESLGTDWLSEPLAMDLAAPLEANFWMNQWGDAYCLIGNRFHFNDAYGPCSLLGPDLLESCIARHFDPPVGALVPRAVLSFSFEVYYFNCMGYFSDYEGTVSLRGETLLAFAGDFHGEHAVDIDLSGVADGTVVPVRVDLSTGMHYTMNYIIDDTPTARASFSAIKAQY